MVFSQPQRWFTAGSKPVIEKSFRCQILSDPLACSSLPAPVCWPMPLWPQRRWFWPFYVDKTNMPPGKNGWSYARPLQKAQARYLLPFFWLPFSFFFLLEVFSLFTQLLLECKSIPAYNFIRHLLNPKGFSFIYGIIAVLWLGRCYFFLLPKWAIFRWLPLYMVIEPWLLILKAFREE